MFKARIGKGTVEFFQRTFRHLGNFRQTVHEVKSVFKNKVLKVTEDFRILIKHEGIEIIAVL